MLFGFGSQIQQGKVVQAKRTVVEQWRTVRRHIIRSRALNILEQHCHAKQAIRAMALARASGPLSKWFQFCCYKKKIRDTGLNLPLLCMVCDCDRHLCAHTQTWIFPSAHSQANRRGSRLRSWKAALEIRSKYGQVERILCHRMEARLQVEAAGVWKQGLEKKKHLQWLKKMEKADGHRKMVIYENAISAWSRQCAIW